MSRALTIQRRRASATLTIMALLAGLLLALGVRPAHAASTAEVAITNYTFSPASLTITPGETVTWVNEDNVAHTVTSSDGSNTLNSPLIQPGQKWSYTFTKSGTYSYYCSVHPDMTGKVTVSASSGSSGGTTTTTSPGMGGMGGSSGSASGPGSNCTNQNIATSTMTPFVQHFETAHLEQSPGQQAAAALNTDQYVQMHTILLEHMAEPSFDLLLAAPNGINPFITHVNNGHLGESPAQQANDILNTNQYVNTHTVLIENMLYPTTASVTGTYGC